MNKKTDEAQNAENYAETIIALYKAYIALAKGAEIAKAEDNEYTSTSEVRAYVQESVLSVEVRSNWYSLCDTIKVKPTEYRILLSYGGPALQITGRLNNYCEPDKNPQLQHQNWGTPWTDYMPDIAEDEDWEDALFWFVNCFYFEVD